MNDTTPHNVDYRESRYSPTQCRPVPELRAEIIKRFEAKFKAGSGCWEWTGSTQRNGYGTFSITRRPFLAHRVAYTIYVGPIPANTLVLHKCDNRKCARPDHLFLGTRQDNSDDMHAKGRFVSGHAKKTHCHCGHEYPPAAPGVHRTCRICRRDQQRVRRAARKEQT